MVHVEWYGAAAFWRKSWKIGMLGLRDLRLDFIAMYKTINSKKFCAYLRIDFALVDDGQQNPNVENDDFHSFQG